MIINICYNNHSLDLLEEINNFCNNYKDYIIKSFNEDHYKEKKKAYKIKGSYSARMTPFILITNDDNKYIKAFYSESNDCNKDKVINFLNSIL